jgi:hypothetical protein
MVTNRKNHAGCDDIPSRAVAISARLRQYATLSRGFGRHPVALSVSSITSRLGIVVRLALAVVAVAAVLALDGGAAYAQGKLDARYTATLGGIPIGRGAWFIEIGDDKYLAAASGTTAGLMRLFSSGEGTGAARGSIVNGQLVPATYAASITAGRKTSEVRMALGGGNVKTFAVSPESPHDAERVPLTDAHRHGVIDPMTGSIYRVPTNGNPMVPASCNRTVPIFDGRMRYDLHLAFKRMDTVHAAKGYAGPVLVCAVSFVPIAGHIPGRTAIRYLTSLRTMEVWLAPIAGTTVLVPFRYELPTPLGLGMLTATQFVTVAQRPRATPTSVTIH